ncbi:MAG: polyprenyl synthetase family protein [Pseudomonadota bacterium]
MPTAVAVTPAILATPEAFRGVFDPFLARLLVPWLPPGALAEPARAAVLGGGKRLRAYLVAAQAKLLGATAPQQSAQAWRVGAAIECLHAYTLVHDDLPVMDDDDLRRGQPTIHKAYDEATAILVGDGLQAVAFGLLADPATHPESAVRAALVAAMAHAAGFAGVVGGQARDLAGVPTDPAQALETVAMKTGALFAYTTAAAGHLTGTPPDAPAMQALGGFIQAYSAAFQLADDLGDADRPQDGASLLAVEPPGRVRARCQNLVSQAQDHLDFFAADANTLRELAGRVGPLTPVSS